ncbi:hypothetical protein L873DRAFT_1807707 [Choiromyces venosus 120613-1]|uniref:Uncharacterized protein n=1 Tax=Choiromyces venosus 120613-1 TaxID=1336337 RepID=A0A3N4JKC1_9PEZI|nr:hypothetical protein L873DRAFT_1807707 [Choiromyces venosus 120613-1]
MAEDSVTAKKDQSHSLRNRLDSRTKEWTQIQYLQRAKGQVNPQGRKLEQKPGRGQGGSVPKYLKPKSRRLPVLA